MVEERRVKYRIKYVGIVVFEIKDLSICFGRELKFKVVCICLYL